MYIVCLLAPHLCFSRSIRISSSYLNHPYVTLHFHCFASLEEEEEEGGEGFIC